jgi:hypothetical protein
VAGAVVGHHLCHDTSAQHREVLKQHAVLAAFMHICAMTHQHSTVRC